MTVNEMDVREILERLTRIETKLEDQKPRLDGHGGRIRALEQQMGRQNFVASVLGALAAGAVLMVKYLTSGGGK